MVSRLLDEEIPEAEEPRTFRAALRALQGGSSASQFLLAAAVVVAVAIVGITHSGEVRKGAHALVGADLGWLSLAILASVALWGIGTVTQFGSMPVSPPVRQVFAVQIWPKPARQKRPPRAANATKSRRGTLGGHPKPAIDRQLKPGHSR